MRVQHVMAETSQSAIRPYVAVAAVGLALNAWTAVCREALVVKVPGGEDGGEGGGSGGEGGDGGGEGGEGGEGGDGGDACHMCMHMCTCVMFIPCT